MPPSGTSNIIEELSASTETSTSSSLPAQARLNNKHRNKNNANSTHTVAGIPWKTAAATLCKLERAALKRVPILMSPTLTLRSKDLGGIVRTPQRHVSVGGKDLSPALFWTAKPEGTRSFAVTLHDQDAPTGSGFWHWLVVDLPPSARALPTGAGTPGSGLLPPGAVQIRNDAGVEGYTGSFPPPGDDWHLYLVTLYALDTDTLQVTADTPAAQVGFLIWQHTLEKASLVFYDRVPRQEE